jgi:hypothetical protein
MIIAYLLFGGAFSRLNEMRIIWSDDQSINQFLNKKQKKHFDINTFRKFDDKVLTGNSDHDRMVIADFKNLVNNLKTSPDTTLAYSITFSNNARYDNIVEVIDICDNYSIKNFSFILYDNKALIWKGTPYFSPHLPMIDFTSASFGITDDVPPPKPTLYEKFVGFVKKASQEFRSFWPSAIALVLMVWCAIFKKKSYLNLKSFNLSNRESLL